MAASPGLQDPSRTSEAHIKVDSDALCSSSAFRAAQDGVRLALGPMAPRSASPLGGRTSRRHETAATGRIQSGACLPSVDGTPCGNAEPGDGTLGNSHVSSLAGEVDVRAAAAIKLDRDTALEAIPAPKQ